MAPPNSNRCLTRKSSALMPPSSPRVLVMVLLVPLIYPASATDHTYIVNKSTKTVVATTSYPGGNSQFLNRVIKPNTQDGDEYNPVDHVHIELWVDGAKIHQSVDVGSDTSILLQDNPNKAGVDVVESAYGDLNKPYGPVKATIYPLGDVRGLNPLAKDGINNHIDLGNVLPSQPFTLFADPGTDCAKSLQGKKLACPQQLTAQRAVYGRDTPFQSVTICACDGAPFDVPALAAAVAKVPQFLLHNIKGVTAIAANGRGAADTVGTTGQVTVYTKIPTNGFIHESAHALDTVALGTGTDVSQGAAFKQALSDDTCTASEYATTSNAEAYTEDMIVFLYKLWKDKNPLTDSNCMDAQLGVIASSVTPGIQDYINQVKATKAG